MHIISAANNLKFHNLNQSQECIVESLLL